MSFCKHCGSQIPEDSVCHCPAATAEREARAAAAQAQPPQPPYAPPEQPYAPAQPYAQQPYPQPPYGAPEAEPKPQRNVMGDLLGALKGSFKSPAKTVAERQQAKDWLTPAILCGVLFLALLIANVCIFAKTSVMMHPSYLGRPVNTSDDFKFHFGLVLLAAFIETLLIPTLYAAVRLAVAMLFHKPENLGQHLLDALISFGVNSIVPCAAILTGGLLYLWTSMAAQVFFAFAIVWYTVALVIEINGMLPAEKKGFLSLAVTVGLIAAAAIIIILMYRLMFKMNMGYSIYETKYAYDYINKVLGSLNDNGTGFSVLRGLSGL